MRHSAHATIPLHLWLQHTRADRGFEKHGWDDENSAAFFIEAFSEHEALTWGREISQEFVRRLYGDRGLIWRPTDYAHWIEADPASRFRRIAPVASREDR
jgi:hypothetical protein